jgi:hypothetical protein
MLRRYRVFISSNSELSEDRKEIMRAVRACGCDPVAMEDWSCSEENLLKKIIDDVRQCDYLVLLAGNNPSTVYPSEDSPYPGKSYVEIEYEVAREASVRVITLLKEEGRLRDEQNGADPAVQDRIVKWREFREQLRCTLVTKPYSKVVEAGAIVRSSLLSLIRPREQAVVLETNADLIAEIANYLNECERRRKPIESAILLQYSAQNARDILRKLYWEGVKTTLYIANPNSRAKGNKFWFSEHQSACIRDTLKNLRNYIELLRKPAAVADASEQVDPRLEVFQYSAPGSLRVVKLGEDFLAVGAYAYMVKTPKAVPSLDIRGGELPMILFRKEHSGFEMLNTMVEATIRNWHDNDVVKSVAKFPSRMTAAVHSAAD